MVRTPSLDQSEITSKPQSLIKDESPSTTQRRDAKNNATTGASAAGVRAIGSQLIAFYFRAPVKAFFRTRVE